MPSNLLNFHAFDRPGGPVPAARWRSRAPWKRRRESEIDQEGAALDSPTGVVPDTFRSDHRYEIPTPDSYLSVLSAADEPTNSPRSAFFRQTRASSTEDGHKFISAPRFPPGGGRGTPPTPGSLGSSGKEVVDGPIPRHRAVSRRLMPMAARHQSVS